MTIINADCLEWMKSQSDNSIDCIITDPPYGLKFMGKKWDYQIPSIEIWQEALRICKPGSWMLCFGGTRTYHRMTCNIEDAGWEIRDCIMWLYGSGFPKGKGCLKPAYEPIVLARKKFSNPELNIDECRIESNNRPLIVSDRHEGNNTYGSGLSGSFSNGKTGLGRWPANVILDDVSAQILDEQTIGVIHGAGKKRVDPKAIQKGDGALFGMGNHENNGMRFGDSGGASRFFYCAKASSSERNVGLEGLPVKEKRTLNEFPNNTDFDPNTTQNKCGSSQQNHHPTVKPLKLMEYLIKLIVPKGGTVLDPFAGSGTTILAAQNLNVKSIGIELEKEYCDIAKERLKNNDKQLKLNI